MQPKRKQRLQLVLFLLVGSSLTLAMVLYALRENLNVYYAPSEIIQAHLGRTIRTGGLVVRGSVQHLAGQELGVSFLVTDNSHQLTVYYKGLLPDTFREGQGVIAIGKLIQPDLLQADQVLAKHDENYRPPEISTTLKQAYD